MAPSGRSGFVLHQGQGERMPAGGQSFGSVEHATGEDAEVPIEVLRRMAAVSRARVMRRRPPPALTADAGPQQYDEAGFPIPQRLPSFTERVRRLLAG